MGLEFIYKLQENELLELINYCIKSQNDKLKYESEKQSYIEYFSMFNEEIREDLGGIKYARLMTSSENGKWILNDYIISDFGMRNDGVGENYTYETFIYDEYLIEWMTNHFGKDYIRALTRHRLNALSKLLDNNQVESRGR